MSSTTLTRRALLAGAGATVSSAALAIAIVPAVTADEVCALPIDPETDGLAGLPLAAIHIERAIAAMAMPGLPGRWSVKLYSGDADQNWGFAQESVRARTAVDRAEEHLTNYRKAMMEADPTITGWTASYAVDTGLLHSISIERRA